MLVSRTVRIVVAVALTVVALVLAGSLQSQSRPAQAADTTWSAPADAHAGDHVEEADAHVGAVPDDTTW
jgi:cytochrome c-type biogenesis protein CcmH/NrfG